MKTRVWAVVCVVMCLFAGAALAVGAPLATNGDPAMKIEKGDRATVPNWTWVDVKNSAGIDNGNVHFGYGESCGIDHGDIVEVVGIDEDRVLVRYEKYRRTSYGTECPNGTIFFLEKKVFAGMTAEYKKTLAVEVAEKKTIERLLAEE